MHNNLGIVYYINKIELLRRIKIDKDTKTLIIASGEREKFQLYKYFYTINDQDIKKEILSLELRLSSVSDIIELYRKFNYKSIENILASKYCKTELKEEAIWHSFLMSNKLQDAIKQTNNEINDKNLLGMAKVWTHSEEVLAIIEKFYDDIIEGRLVDIIKNEYIQNSQKNLFILNFEEINTEGSYNNIIIIDGGSKNYDKILPQITNPKSTDSIVAEIIKRAKNIDICVKEGVSSKFINFIKSVKHEENNISYKTNKTNMEQVFCGTGRLPQTLTPKQISKLIENPFCFYIDCVLKIKPKRPFIFNLSKYNISAIANFSDHGNDSLAIMPILNRYKIKNAISDIVKTLKINIGVQKLEHGTKRKISYLFDKNEIIFEPDLVIYSTEGEKHLFNTLESSNKITGGKDVYSAIISSLDDKAYSINTKEQFIVQTKNKDIMPEVQEILTHYNKTEQKYINTDKNDVTELEYQHISRKILIKNKW